MSGAVKVLADVLWVIGERALSHSRRLSPRQLKQEFAHWNKPHLCTAAGTCLICGAHDVRYDPKIICPGTPAQQRARVELALGDYELHT